MASFGNVWIFYIVRMPACGDVHSVPDAAGLGGGHSHDIEGLTGGSSERTQMQCRGFLRGNMLMCMCKHVCHDINVLSDSNP